MKDETKIPSKYIRRCIYVFFRNFWDFLWTVRQNQMIAPLIAILFDVGE